jgi:Tfp pilus assembly protein PilP
MGVLAMNNTTHLRVQPHGKSRFGRRSPGDVIVAGVAVLAVTTMGAMPLATAEQQRPPVVAPPATASVPPPAATASPAAPHAAAPAAPAAASHAAAVTPPSSFTYEAGGRRDPFISLANQGSDPRSEGRTRYQGLAGLGVGEVNVKGIVLYERQLVAMVQAPDNRTYLVRPNDRMLDGSVLAVTSEAVVFVQQVNDPLSLVKQREIRKALRAPEEAK